jgi:regulator of sigma E protease
MVFATVAKLRGRALPANFVMTAQSVFLVLILTMFVYVSYSDVRRWARDVQEERANPASEK